jgi:hypothetical protein
MRTHPARKPTTLEELDILSSSELRALYPDIIGHAPPQRASRAFLLGNLCWALQVRQGGLDPGTLRQQLISGKKAGKRRGEYLQPGTRLVREWHGKTYEVTVAKQGFRYQGRQYRSLTHIARAITGANWSGPRFFGLKVTSR